MDVGPRACGLSAPRRCEIRTLMVFRASFASQARKLLHVGCSYASHLEIRNVPRWARINPHLCQGRRNLLRQTQQLLLCPV